MLDLNTFNTIILEILKLIGLAIVLYPPVRWFTRRGDAEKYEKAFRWTYLELWKHRGRRFPDKLEGLERWLWLDLDIGTKDLLKLIEEERPKECI